MHIINEKRNRNNRITSQHKSIYTILYAQDAAAEPNTHTARVTQLGNNIPYLKTHMSTHTRIAQTTYMYMGTSAHTHTHKWAQAHDEPISRCPIHSSTIYIFVFCVRGGEKKIRKSWNVLHRPRWWSNRRRAYSLSSVKSACCKFIWVCVCDCILKCC